MTLIQTETGVFDPRAGRNTRTVMRLASPTPIYKSPRPLAREEREYRQCVEAGIPAFPPKGETQVERQIRCVHIREKLGLTFGAIGHRIGGVNPSRARGVYLRGKRWEQVSPKGETPTERRFRAVYLRDTLGLTFRALGCRLGGVSACRARQIYRSGKLRERGAESC